jgi:hypothetical protein
MQSALVFQQYEHTKRTMLQAIITRRLPEIYKDYKCKSKENLCIPRESNDGCMELYHLGTCMTCMGLYSMHIIVVCFINPSCTTSHDSQSCCHAAKQYFLFLFRISVISGKLILTKLITRLLLNVFSCPISYKYI